MPKTKVIKTSTCPQCRKILEPSDVTEDVWSGDGFGRSLSKILRCPNCNQAIWAEMPNEKTKKRTKKYELPGRYKNFPITIAKSDDPIYKSGLTVYSIQKSPASTSASPKSSDGGKHKKIKTDEQGDQLGIATCKSLIAGLPTEWYSWPAAISVGFVQTPNTGLHQRLFEEYTADSMERALDVLFVEKHQYMFIGYRFKADGFVPAYEYFAAWPLARKGKDEPTEIYIADSAALFCRFSEQGIRRREPKGGAVPWDVVSDDTLFEVWHEPVDLYGNRIVLMLRAGGLTEVDAKRNWELCAKAIRKYRHAMAVDPDVRGQERGRRGNE